MFSVEGNLQLLNVDIDYVQELYRADNEVQFNASNYERKKYLGLLICNGETKYVIPLSSAKLKYKNLDNYGQAHILINEESDREDMHKNDVWIDKVDGKGNPTGKVKHILSIILFKKMIPVKDGVYSIVDFRLSDDDTDEERNYKNLLNKEYGFCVANTDKIVSRANKVYDKQMKTGFVEYKCCNFALLESVMKSYQVQK